MQYASFSFLDPPKTDTNNFLGGIRNFFRLPMKNCQLIFHTKNLFQFLDPPQKTDTNNFLGGIKKFSYTPQKIVSVCLGGESKNKLVYCMKYQLTVFHGGSKKIFLYPPKIVSVYFWGGLKN